ncbi:ankyrin repeat-containing domain protein, partial [Mycena epipterygia]
DPSTPDSYSRTPLSYAVERGHQGIVELLLQQNGVDPNTPDSYSRTPLSYAASNGHQGIVELL